MSYVSDPDRSESCFICDIQRSSNDAENLLLVRRSVTVAVLNRFPYNTGHLMVAPKRHVAELSELSQTERLEMMTTASDCIEALRRSMGPEGFNLGANLGTVAGAGLPGHLHLHVVPRWEGDTNFMPVVAGTKVLPETLEGTYDRLRSELST